MPAFFGARLNPTLNIVNAAGGKIYVGKTFTVVANVAGGHTITLLAGATFQGFGATLNVATFSTVGSFITFLVLSTTKVQILAKDGVAVP